METKDNPGADLLAKTIQKIVPRAQSSVQSVNGNLVTVDVKFAPKALSLKDTPKVISLIKEGLGSHFISARPSGGNSISVECTTLSLVKSAAKTADENLTLLGVDGSKNPTVSRYPKSYNPKAHSLWPLAIAKVTMTDDTQDNWMRAIRAFLALCRSEGVEPFDNSNIDVINEGIESWLKSNRLKCIKYADDTGIFKHFVIRSVKRTVQVSGQHERNFFVRNVASLRAIEDPTLEKWLVGSPLPGFSSDLKGLYTRNVNAATTLKVNFTGKATATIALEIYCHSLPVVPNKQTKKSLAKHIETKMWVPLVTRFRFSGIGNKQF